MEKLEEENIYMKCQRKKTTLRVKIKAKFEMHPRPNVAAAI